uniref:DUF2877 domain-containing protein n=1 Tax=Providencia stuartii TaxID=588 RepID=A0AAI9GIC8_PROST|nr:DUF2877 domain-containing protein [Providencia stuartii]
MDTIKTQRQQLYGISADVAFLQLLDQPAFSGTVEQIFHKALNISVGDTLLTLLSTELDNAPNSCRILNNDFTRLNLQEGDQVYFSGKIIYLADHYFLSFSFCQKWLPKEIFFNPNKINQKQYLSFLNNKVNIIDELLKKEGNSLFNYCGDNLFYLATSEKLNLLRNELINALLKQQYQILPDIIKQFIGLGIGLTPSADDYLVGLMAFLLLKHHPLQHLKCQFQQGINNARTTTTKVSAITLEKAINHQYRENILQLLQMLVAASKKDIYPQFRQILDIGSSSGSDMLFGIRDALYLTHYFGERYVD